MKDLRRLAFLFLLIAAAVLPRASKAQDKVSVLVDPYGGTTCWDVTVKDSNQPGHLPINRFGLKIASANAVFQDGALGPNNWNASLVGTDSIFYIATGGSITYPTSLSGFGFCLDNPTYDEPVTIEWTTMSNSTVVTKGQFTVIPVTFQSIAQLDTVTGTGSVVNNDPCFNFTVTNRNSVTYSIDQISFQVLGQTAGTVRPGSVVAPTGWIYDSSNVNTAFFHAGIGNTLDPGNSLSGFKVCMRGNPTYTAFSWAWRAYHEGLLIERDTVRNIPVSGFGSSVSYDSVIATRQSGCLYNFTVKNFHSLNIAAPSRIDKLVLTSLTSGVKFLAATTTPPNWGKAINTAGDVLTYQAATLNDALASGQVSSFFAANIDNPTGGTFGLRWIAYSGSTAIDTGTFSLTCSTSAPADDVAAIAAGTANCGFKVTVDNKHSPPSNVASIVLSASGATFSGQPAVVPSTWNTTVINSTTIKYSAATSTDYLATNASANLLFQIDPPTSGPASITWTTYDANNTKISTGTLQANCSATSTDKITLTVDDANTCRYALVVENQRGNGSSITNIEVAPTGGWKVDSLGAPLGWTTNIDANGVATLSNSIGIPDFTQQGFHLGFRGVGTLPNFNVIVNSTNNDNIALHDTLPLTCTPTSGVPMGAQEVLAMSVSPNPLHQIANITYSLPYREYVTITLLDIMGRAQSTLVSDMTESGEHLATLNANTLPAGTYYLRMETPSSRITRKLVIEK